jgi:hypothetical protein
MLETYILYTTIFIAAAFWAYIAQRGSDAPQRMWARAFCFMCLFLPAALRYGIGTDYAAYHTIYEHGFPDYMQTLEPGFVFIGHLCRMIGLPPVAFIAVISGMTYALICFCTPRKHIFTIVTFYILSFIYLNSYSMVRQTLALSMLLCAFSLFYENHRIKGIFLLAAASLMHYSSLVAVPILIFSMMNINTYLRICLIAIFVFIGLNEEFLSALISFAASINPRNAALSLLLIRTELNLGVTFIILALPTALILLNTKKIKQLDNGNFILNANAIFLAVIFLAFGVAIMGRFIMALFFIPLFSIQILYNANRRYAKVYHAFLILCFCTLFVRYIEHHTIGRPAGYGIAPYRSVFER